MEVNSAGVDWHARRRAAFELAVEAGWGARDAESIVDLARPAARLVAVPGRSVPPGGTKLGGLPDLPADVDWPRSKDRPMTFCGQVRTSEVAFLHGVDGWTPRARVLSFFAARDPEHDLDAAGQVLALPDGELEARAAPPDLPETSRWEGSALDVVPVLSPPMAELIEIGVELDLDLDLDDWAAWMRLFRSLGCGEPSIAAGHHQLLGRPWQVGMLDPLWTGAIKLFEGPEEPDDLADRYRLLAQFTTDQEANVEIDDAGAVYFVISPQDLAAERYERTSVHFESN